MRMATKIAAMVSLLISFSMSWAFAQNLRIGGTGLSGEYLPLWVAQDKGLFRKYGTGSEVITFQGGPLAVQSLLSGEIKFHVGAANSIIDAQVGGAKIVMVSIFINTLPYTLVASEKIRSAEQLRGKRFAVSRLGAVSDVSLRMALKNMGTDAKDAVILGIGDQSSRFASLKAGVVDATVISPPLTITARKLGFNLLGSFQDAGIEWAYNSISISADYARTNRETIVNFLRAFVSGLAFIHKDREESLRILSKWMRLTDREALEETYDHLLKILLKKPYGTAQGIQVILDDIGRRNPKAREFKPQNLLDVQYLRELDQTGFIDKAFQ
jgi:NitT/TauT family transport system substrate-binding protein